MALIQDKDKPKIEKHLSQLEQPVRIVNFTQELECQYCHETRQLMEELEELSGKIELEVYDFVSNKEEAASYGVDKIPATVLVGEKDQGIRYFGVPAGYEFTALLEDIAMVSKRASGLSPASRERLAGLDVPVHLQIFVTPT
jgi:glutaredoxin-like protein